jgi:hypothetical protein
LNQYLRIIQLRRERRIRGRGLPVPYIQKKNHVRNLKEAASTVLKSQLALQWSPSVNMLTLVLMMIGRELRLC